MIRLTLTILLLIGTIFSTLSVSSIGLQAAYAQSAPSSGRVPAAAPAPAAAPTAVDARRALDVLKDDRRRAELIAILEAIVAAQTSTPAGNTPAIPSQPAGGTPAPAPGPDGTAKPAEPETQGLSIPLAPDGLGANLMVGAAELLNRIGGRLRESAALASGLPRLAEWAWEMLANPSARELLLSTCWRLVLGFAAGWICIRLARRLLRRPRAALVARARLPVVDPVVGLERAERGETEAPPLTRRTPWRAHPLLHRLPYALGCLGLDLLAVLAFLLGTHLITATPAGGTYLMQLVLLAPLQAFALWQATMCVSAALTAPHLPHMRLLPIGDASAAYLHRQVYWLSGLIILGNAVARVGWLLGLSLPAHALLETTILLIAHIGAGVVVLRQRKAVAAWLRADRSVPGAGDDAPNPVLDDHVVDAGPTDDTVKGVSAPQPAGWAGFAWLRVRLAPVWHWLAISALIALWILLVLNPAGGATQILLPLLGSLLVVTATRVANIAVCRALNRATQPGVSTHGLPPGLLIWLRGGARLAIVLLGALALLQIWGVAVVPWLFSTALGWQFLGSMGTIGVTVLLAVAIWEGANMGIKRHIARLATGAGAARAARLRTLLPMLRTTLFVGILIMVGLTVLGQLGVNIAPLVAGAGVLGIAIGFGSQKLVQDVITGLFLLLENVMQVGDVVTLGGLTGVVEELSVRSIRLRAEDGAVHVIPFSAVTTVTNTTRDFGQAVIEARVAIAEDYDRVVQLLRDVFTEMRAEALWQTDIIADLDMMGLSKLEDSFMTIKCRLKCRPFARGRVLREFQRRMQQRFNAVGIIAPAPA